MYVLGKKENKMNFFIITLGCKVNRYESEAMHKKIEDSGFTNSINAADSDIIIINSCTVTAQSDQKVRQILNKMRRENANRMIVLTGCMPQAFPDTVDSFDADIILGNSNRLKIVDYINEFILNKKKIIDIELHKNNEKFERIEINRFHERTRAFIKIEDGCNRFCSYCIIPYARGRVRSRRIEDIEKEIIELSDNGYKEVVLVGINLSAYKTENDGDLCDVVDAVCKIDKIERVRLGSLEPDQINEKVIQRLSFQKKFCSQFHLSLQSGCDETLRRMNRHYYTSEYLEIIQNIRKYFSNPSITTDIMVGFPGESDEEFLKSLEFVKGIGFTRAHVFQYSRRLGTKAADFSNQITNAVKKERSKMMIEATNKAREDFLKSQVGKIEKVLFETNLYPNVYEGYTQNYISIKVMSESDIRGKIINVKIIEAKENYCFSELIY